MPSRLEVGAQRAHRAHLISRARVRHRDHGLLPVLVEVLEARIVTSSPREASKARSFDVEGDELEAPQRRGEPHGAAAARGRAARRA